MRIEVSQLPPSEYSPNWRGHWTERYRAGRVYQAAVFYSGVDTRNRALMEGVLFPFTKAKIKLTFVFPEWRLRDSDNLIARFKPGLDGIVSAGLVVDDDAEHLKILDPDIVVDPKRAPLTIIELEEVKDESHL